MVLAAHTIKPSRGSKRTSKRVGRGNGSGKGTYSARGLKGQRARSGGKRGVKRLGFKQSLQKVPKSRGFRSPHGAAQTVTLRTLNRIATPGQEVTPALLKKLQVIKSTRYPIKIVATGTLDKAITISKCLASKTAVEMIEKAGGKIFS